MSIKKNLLFLLIFGWLFGCAPYVNQPMKTANARLGAESYAGRDQFEFPAPEEKIVAAVYKFRDQTGQYKPTETGNSFSTAVTQGATSILLRALEESDWFVPIERENLGNLLNERKIIRSSRAEYGDDTSLPPLLFAGVMLEGGIVSYDANTMTGGAGLRYFGAGASGQYREDRITIYLRAISTTNGRILKTVYTSKTILSQMVDVGLFRFVKFQRLLEAETGFTYNEPSEMAVKEAIEKAVESLILEGIMDGLWEPANAEDKNSPAIQNYLEEKLENQQIDVLGRELRERRTKFGIGIKGGAQLYAGDYADARLRPGGGVSFSYGLSSRFALSAHFEKLQLGTKNFYEGNFSALGIRLRYNFLPKDVFTPYLFIGPNITTENNSGFFDFSNTFYLGNVTGLGFEYFLNEKLGLNLSFSHHFIFDDNLDGEVQGNYNDFFWSGGVGITYYFGRSLYNQAD